MNVDLCFLEPRFDNIEGVATVNSILQTIVARQTGRLESGPALEIVGVAPTPAITAEYTANSLEAFDSVKAGWEAFSAPVGSVGAPGKGNGNKVNATAARQDAASNQAGAQEAAKARSVNLTESIQQAQLQQAIRSGPVAGPTGPARKKAAAADAPETATPSRDPVQPLPAQGTRGASRPEPAAGKTSDGLDVSAGKPGVRELKQEHKNQADALDRNEKNQELHLQREREATQQKRELDQAKVEIRQQEKAQEQKVKDDQRVLDKSRKQASQQEQLRTEAAADVQEDRQQVASDQQIVTTTEGQLSQARTSESEADSEVNEASTMTKEAEQAVQRAAEYKPGNGPGNQGAGNQGAGKQGAQGATGGGGGAAQKAPAEKAPAKAAKGQTEPAQGGSSNGQGNGVAWQSALKSATQFQQQAVARKQAADQRKQTTQRTTAEAEKKLTKDKQGLEKSEQRLATSDSNLKTHERDLARANEAVQANKQTFNADQAKVKVIKRRGSALYKRADRVRAKHSIRERDVEVLKDDQAKGLVNMSLIEDLLKIGASDDVRRLDLNPIRSETDPEFVRRQESADSRPPTNSKS